MKHSAITRRAIGAALFAAFGAVCWVAQAQSASSAPAPRGLEWMTMNESVFDSPGEPSSSGSMERTFAQMIWGDQAGGGIILKGWPSPSYALVAVVEMEGGTMHVLSLYRRHDLCENTTTDDTSQTGLHAICPMRVLTLSRDGHERIRKHAGFCYLNHDNTEFRRSKHHTEFALDSRTSTAHFRTIERGKVVPSCNRSIKLSAK